MDRRWIKLTSISGKGIRSFALFQNPPLYVTISVNGRRKQTTPPAQTGGENPVWESPVRIDLENEPDLVLEFDLMAKGNLLLLAGDKLVGKVNVPVNDLLAEGLDGSVRHVSYQVTSPEGRPNGVLSFSYKFNQPPPRQMNPPVPSPPGAYYPPPPPSALYPPPAVSCYPPPPPPPEHVPYYPPPMPVPAHGHVAYYPPSEHVACYPPSIADPACCYRPPAADPTCCYPPPPHDPYGYRPETSDRRLY